MTSDFQANIYKVPGGSHTEVIGFLDARANSHRSSLDTGPSGGAGAASVEDAGFVWIHNKVRLAATASTIRALSLSNTVYSITCDKHYKVISCYMALYTL